MHHGLKMLNPDELGDRSRAIAVAILSCWPDDTGPKTLRG